MFFQIFFSLSFSLLFSAIPITWMLKLFDIFPLKLCSHVFNLFLPWPPFGWFLLTCFQFQWSLLLSGLVLTSLTTSPVNNIFPNNYNHHFLVFYLVLFRASIYFLKFSIPSLIRFMLFYGFFNIFIIAI